MSNERTRFDAQPPDAGADDPRLDAPAFHRNGAAIVEALAPRLRDAAGVVLEVGSGTGQHAALLARSFPQLIWQPSDPAPAHRASIDAWRAHVAIETLRPALDLDVSAEDWALEQTLARDGFAGLFCANVIHIAPWSVAEGLFRGAARHLRAGGFLALYGPFRWRGRHVSQSNEAFDAQLRLRDGAWGVRDTDDLDRLAAAHGLKRVDVVEMPSNNHMLFFSRVSA